MLTFHELKIPSYLWPCLFYIYPVKFIRKAIDMQICPDLSLHISTCSSWPTSVKPIFPAWKALRVNSPASAGLMPGTLPEKHTQAHTQNENINTCMRHGLDVRHTHYTHTQRRRSKCKVNVSLRVHMEWKQTQMRRLKGWHFHCFHSHFSSLIRGRQWWGQTHLENGGHDLLSGAKCSATHFIGYLTNIITSFHFGLINIKSAMACTAP